MYDFIWTINSIEENEYPLTGITFKYNLQIQAFLFTVKSKYIGPGFDYPKGLLNFVDHYSNQIGYFDIYIIIFILWVIILKTYFLILDIIMELIK